MDQHFATTGQVPNRAPAMWLKTAVVMAWFVGSFCLLCFWATHWWEALALSISLGLAMSAIGFNIQHDGNHGGYSPRAGVNRVMAFTLDVLGGSSYIWSWKHNVFHHSNPNVAGADADIDIEPFCRLSPNQTLRPGHRFQHLYIWLLYSLLAVKWQFVDDFKDLASGRIGEHPFPRPKGWTLAALIFGKVLFVSWAMVLPAVLHPVWQVAVCYLVASMTLSLSLAITFQLAHVVEDARFPTLPTDNEWAVHQLETTVDFATDNRVLSWLIGGLNFQVEHHLFPKVCHVYLPQVAPIVEQTCREYGFRYNTNPTLRSALVSHARWLYQLGRPQEAGGG